MRLQSLHQYQLIWNYMDKRLQDYAENHLHFMFVLYFMLMFDARSPTLNKGREGTRRERCYLSFHNREIKNSIFHHHAPSTAHQKLFSEEKGATKKKKKKKRVRKTRDCRFQIDAKRLPKICNCTETFHFPNNLATKLPVLGERSSDRFLNGCFVIQPVQPRRGGLSEEV